MTQYLHLNIFGACTHSTHCSTDISKFLGYLLFSINSIMYKCKKKKKNCAVTKRKRRTNVGPMSDYDKRFIS